MNQHITFEETAMKTPSSIICERHGIETENYIDSWSDDSEAIFRLREENNYI
jgi:hypothetical protein